MIYGWVMKCIACRKKRKLRKNPPPEYGFNENDEIGFMEKIENTQEFLKAQTLVAGKTFVN